MPATVVTPEDLQTLKLELITEIQKLLSRRQTTPARQWLKSHEVRRPDGLAGYPADLRVNGTLFFTKIRAVIFFLRL